MKDRRLVIVIVIALLSLFSLFGCAQSNEQTIEKVNVNSNIENNEEEDKELQGSGISNGETSVDQADKKEPSLKLLPTKPMVYVYSFKIPMKEDKIYRDTYIHIQDGYAQKVREVVSGNDGKDTTFSEIYYEDETGYYSVLDSKREMNPFDNYIDEIKQNEKRLLIRYPIKKGDEVHFNSNKGTVWIVEEYPTKLEEIMIIGDNKDKVIKVAIHSEGKKKAEHYYVPSIGLVKTHMLDFPDQPLELLKMSEYKE